jgi:hypothetical protein
VALNISNASKYKGNIQALKDIAKKQEDLLPFTNLFDTLARSVAAVIAELQDSLKEKKANATGSLSQSILATPDEQTRDRVSININYNAYGNDADKGRKAEGFSKDKRNKLQPNIYKWVISPGKAQAFSSVASNKQQARSLSYAIATNILKKGTKGNKWLTDVTGKNNERLNKFISQEISKALGKDMQFFITTETDKLNGNNS